MGHFHILWQGKYQFFTQKDVEMSLPLEIRRFHPVIHKKNHRILKKN